MPSHLSLAAFVLCMYPGQANSKSVCPCPTALVDAFLQRSGLWGRIVCTTLLCCPDSHVMIVRCRMSQVLFEAQGRNNRQKAVDLEDIKFHQCVRLARFDNDRTISFIPPDGAFDLMSYRLSQNIK